MPAELEMSALQHPIDPADVSPEFLAMLQANGYITFEDILKEPLHELPFKIKSNFRMLRELVQLLESHGLSQHLDDWEDA